MHSTRNIQMCLGAICCFICLVTIAGCSESAQSDEIASPASGYVVGPQNFGHLQTDVDSDALTFWAGAHAVIDDEEAASDGIQIFDASDAPVDGTFDLIGTDSHSKPYEIVFEPSAPLGEGWYSARLFPEGEHLPRDQYGEERSYELRFFVGTTHPQVARVEFQLPDDDHEQVDAVVIEFSEPVLIPEETAILANGHEGFRFDGGVGTSDDQPPAEDDKVRDAAFIRLAEPLDHESAVELTFEGIESAESGLPLSAPPEALAWDEEPASWSETDSSLTLRIAASDAAGDGPQKSYETHPR